MKIVRDPAFWLNFVGVVGFMLMRRPSSLLSGWPAGDDTSAVPTLSPKKTARTIVLPADAPHIRVLVEGGTARPKN